MSFHFGSVSTQGSEHTIDAAKSPMELQLVHYDNSLLTEAGAKASTNADALAVVTFLFEVSKTFLHYKHHFHVIFNRLTLPTMLILHQSPANLLMF